MEVKIGIENSPRELVVETTQEREEVEGLVTAALQDSSVLQLTDTKGRLIVVLGSKVTYVEIGGGVAGQVGFRS
jgi:hypothetical protein